MTTYHANQEVNPGVYFQPRQLAFQIVNPGQTLPGDGAETYYRVPVYAPLVLGPLLGLMYVLFLPLIGLVMLASFLFERLAQEIGDLAASSVRVLRPAWEPARAFLSRHESKKPADSAPSDEWADKTARDLDDKNDGEGA